MHSWGFMAPRSDQRAGFGPALGRPVQAVQSHRFPLRKENREMRFIRGGSWSSNPHCGRVFFRGRRDPSERHDFIGFRCVRSSPQDGELSVRGGAWHDHPGLPPECQDLNGDSDNRFSRGSHLGFRCVRSTT
jgi:formylglycine-generating enzyme required for sulfatase activity